MPHSQAIQSDSSSKGPANHEKANDPLDPMASFVPPPVVLQRTANRLGDQTAYFMRGAESWEGTSWRDYAHQVRQAARALLSLGVEPGDAVAILSFNRPEWAITAFAAMSIGAKPAGIYWTSAVDDVAYVLNHSQAKVLMVENAERLDGMHACMEHVPHLRHVVMFKPDGRKSTSVLPPLDWADFLVKSKEVSDDVLDARLAALCPDDIGALIYTSGTTGPSKAVALSQGNLWWMASTIVKICEADENERMISYLPLAHAAEQMGSMHNQIHAGSPLYYANSMESLGEHLKEVQPTVFFGVPRVWEKMQAAIETKLATATGFKAHLARWAMRVGRAWHERDLAGQPVGPWLSLQKGLAKRLVYRKVQAALGFQHARILSSGAAPIAPESLKFFTGFDLVIRELYGQSEVSGPSTMNLEGATRMGSVGKIVPGMEIRVAEDGELLVRGPNVFKGYMGQAEATAETMQEDWLLTGDLGHVDEDGYVYVTGRKKDLIITSGGKNISPSNIEASLMETHLIEHAVVCGDGRNYLAALVTLDAAALEAFARRAGLPDTASLLNHPQVLQEVQAEIDRVNGRLTRVCQVRKFAILPQTLTVEAGELTPTLKVKRKTVMDRQRALIDAMYANDSN